MERSINKIKIKKLFSKAHEDTVKHVVKTDIGKFYFYLIKDVDLNISGKIIFLPK